MQRMSYALSQVAHRLKRFVEMFGNVMLLNNAPQRVNPNNNHFQNSCYQNMQRSPQKTNAANPNVKNENVMDPEEEKQGSK